VVPDAASAIDDLDGRGSDLEDSVDSMQNEAGGSTLETDAVALSEMRPSAATRSASSNPLRRARRE
jgi:hypothetical protein